MIRFGSGYLIRQIAKHCAYCGVPVSQDYYKKEMLAQGYTAPTADHIIPYCDGGEITVASCGECNNKKKDMYLPEFIRKVRPDALLHLSRYLSELKDKKIGVERKGQIYEFNGEQYCENVARIVEEQTGEKLNYFS